jgi:hypothetical protein
LRPALPGWRIQNSDSSSKRCGSAVAHPRVVIELLFTGSSPITTIASKDSARAQETASGCFITGILDTEHLVSIEKIILLEAQ